MFYQHLAAVLLRKRTKCRCYKVNIGTRRRVTKGHHAAASLPSGSYSLAEADSVSHELLFQMCMTEKIKILEPAWLFPLMRFGCGVRVGSGF